MNEETRALPANGPAETLWTLAGLLNILWRRRLVLLVLTGLGLLAGGVYGLVITPLYRATAQVRPGITAYGTDGAPVRDWRLKDITRYYRTGLYQNRVRELMGWHDASRRPVIRAEFIQAGTSNIQGGNVITLETLSESPVEGRAILEAAVRTFIEYAECDSVGNGLHLTRAGLQVRIAEVGNRLAELDIEAQRIENEIARARLDLTTVDANRQRLDLQLRGMEVANRYRGERAERSDEEVAAILGELEELGQALALLRDERADPAAGRQALGSLLGNQDAGAWILAGLLRRDAESIGAVVQGQLQVRTRAFSSAAAADSLRHEIAQAGLAAEDLLIRLNLELQRERDAIELRIRELQLQENQGLDNRRISLQNEITGLRIQLRALSALEQLGDVEVSSGPVRPRRLLAVALLGLMGLFGSVCLAFALEYFQLHREVILAPAPRRG